MKSNLYEYKGTISGWGPQFDHQTLMSLCNMNDASIAPVMLLADGPIAAYVNELEMTDDEERYIESTYLYNSAIGLNLVGIVVPSTDPMIPAKAILQTFSHGRIQLQVFGPTEPINTRKPAPMSREDYHKYCEARRTLIYGDDD